MWKVVVVLNEKINGKYEKKNMGCNNNGNKHDKIYWLPEFVFKKSYFERPFCRIRFIFSRKTALLSLTTDHPVDLPEVN